MNAIEPRPCKTCRRVHDTIAAGDRVLVTGCIAGFHVGRKGAVARDQSKAFFDGYCVNFADGGHCHSALVHLIEAHP